MGLKTFTIDFAEFSQETLVRSNYKTAILGIEIKNHIQKSDNKFIRLKEYFDIVSGFAFKSVDYEREGLPLIRIGDVGNDFDENNMVFLPEDYKEDYERFLLKKNDIVVSLTGDGKLKSDLILEDDKYLLNQRVGGLRAKENTNVLFFYYLINYYSLTRKQFYWWSNGKTQLNISPFDFLKIKIPLIAKSKQDQIVIQIQPIEKKIKELKAQITPSQKIINKVFAGEFGFNLEKFEELKKSRCFEVDFSKISTPLIRSTVIQNKTSTNFLKSFLSKNSIFLKDVVLKPIKRGKQPEYKEDGIKVIKTLNIQKGKITFEEVQFVSEKFLKDNEEKAGIYQNDLLLTSTGMGRGKFALYEDEEICFADSHISIIRFNQEKINPNFLNYYCQSFFGTEQLKYIEMHIKGTPEIYETQLNYFQIPNIFLKAQQKIVDEIKAELDKQEEIKSRIESERNKIDEIIKKIF